MDLARMPVPICAICGADSTGIHFGVEACAACSAFFRRTVVLTKNYICNENNDCIIVKDLTGHQRCRACRFHKCIKMGMDRSAVQHRRDAIGKYSSISIAKRECISPSAFTDVIQQQQQQHDQQLRLRLLQHQHHHHHHPYHHQLLSDLPTKCSTSSSSEPSPQSPPQPTMPVLDEIRDKYRVLNQRRQLFYSCDQLRTIFDPSQPLKPVELTDFGECMYQLWRIEPRLCADFITSLKFFALLDADEKMKLFKNFLLLFQAVEEPYLTMTHGGLEKKWWMMPNRTYIDFHRADFYFEQLMMKALKLDKETAISIFQPSFQHALDLVGEQMHAMKLTEVEMIALAAVLLLDPNTRQLEESTRDTVKKLRDQLFRDLFVYYAANDDIADTAAERFGNLLLLTSAVRVHAQRSLENMHLLRFFDVIPRDKLFDEMWT